MKHLTNFLPLLLLAVSVFTFSACQKEAAKTIEGTFSGTASGYYNDVAFTSAFGHLVTVTRVSATSVSISGNNFDAFNVDIDINGKTVVVATGDSNTALTLTYEDSEESLTFSYTDETNTSPATPNAIAYTGFKN